MAQEGVEPSASLGLSESGLPVAYRAVDGIDRLHAEAVGLEPTSGPRPPPVFETGPSSSRMTSVRTGVDKKFRGLESNQRPPRSERGVTTTSNCPGFGKEDSNLHRLIQSQGAYRLADSRERPAGVEPACRTWEARA
jgi:hypothetical protein